MKLTNELIAATPIPVSGGKKLFDGAGLFLYVQSRGRPSWRLKYSFGGRESSLSLGAYPEVSIEAARDAARKARECIKQNRDPAQERREERTALHVATVTTFKVAAESFLAKDDSLAQRTRDKHAWLLSLLTPLHKRPLATIKAPDVLRVLEGIAATGKREAARRCGQFIGEYFATLSTAVGTIRPTPQSICAANCRRSKPNRMPALSTLPVLASSCA